jgi:hypothetical protein
MKTNSLQIHQALDMNLQVLLNTLLSSFFASLLSLGAIFDLRAND